MKTDVRQVVQKRVQAPYLVDQNVNDCLKRAVISIEYPIVQRRILRIHEGPQAGAKRPRNVVYRTNLRVSKELNLIVPDERSR